MDHKQFQEWLSGIDHLSPAQRQQTEAVFPGDTETSASLAAIEAAVGEGSPVPALWHARRHIAWQGKGSATVPVQGMQEDIQCRDRHPLVGSAPQGQVACLRSLSCRWAGGSRFSRTLRTCRQYRLALAAPISCRKRPEGTQALTGIVEADETCVPESRKGARNLERKAQRRGGKASRRGLSDEQVPVLVAADRSGATVSAVLPAVNADTLREVIAPVVDEDIVLVTDGHRACPRCAAAIGAHHEALNLSRSERVRGAFHIQIAADPVVNNRHSRLQDFFRRYRGVATRYLNNDLRWFQRLELENASPRACFATAIARPCIQFVN